jgi:hypothetical protein
MLLHDAPCSSPCCDRALAWRSLGSAALWLGPALVIFYRGLVDVCKSFLDPFGIFDTNVEILVPVLVKDANSASTRFIDAAQAFPEA